MSRINLHEERKCYTPCSLATANALAMGAGEVGRHVLRKWKALHLDCTRLATSQKLLANIEKHIPTWKAVEAAQAKDNWEEFDLPLGLKVFLRGELERINSLAPEDAVRDIQVGSRELVRPAKLGVHEAMLDIPTEAGQPPATPNFDTLVKSMEALGRHTEERLARKLSDDAIRMIVSFAQDASTKPEALQQRLFAHADEPRHVDDWQALLNDKAFGRAVEKHWPPTPKTPHVSLPEVMAHLQTMARHMDDAVGKHLPPRSKGDSESVRSGVTSEPMLCHYIEKMSALMPDGSRKTEKELDASQKQLRGMLQAWLANASNQPEEVKSMHDIVENCSKYFSAKGERQLRDFLPELHSASDSRVCCHKFGKMLFGKRVQGKVTLGKFIDRLKIKFELDKLEGLEKYENGVAPLDLLARHRLAELVTAVDPEEASKIELEFEEEPDVAATKEITDGVREALTAGKGTDLHNHLVANGDLFFWMRIITAEHIVSVLLHGQGDGLLLPFSAFELTSHPEGERRMLTIFDFRAGAKPVKRTIYEYVSLYHKGSILPVGAGKKELGFKALPVFMSDFSFFLSCFRMRDWFSDTADTGLPCNWDFEFESRFSVRNFLMDLHSTNYRRLTNNALSHAALSGVRYMEFSGSGGFLASVPWWSETVWEWETGQERCASCPFYFTSRKDAGQPPNFLFRHDGKDWLFDTLHNAIFTLYPDDPRGFQIACRYLVHMRRTNTKTEMCTRDFIESIHGNDAQCDRIVSDTATFVGTDGVNEAEKLAKKFFGSDWAGPGSIPAEEVNITSGIFCDYKNNPQRTRLMKYLYGRFRAKSTCWPDISATVTGLDTCSREDLHPYFAYLTPEVTDVINMGKHRSPHFGVRLHLGENVDNASRESFYTSLGMGVDCVEKLSRLGIRTRVGHGVLLNTYPHMFSYVLFLKSKNREMSWEQALVAFQGMNLFSRCVTVECCLTSNALLVQNVKAPWQELDAFATVKGGRLPDLWRVMIHNMWHHSTDNKPPSKAKPGQLYNPAWRLTNHISSTLQLRSSPFTLATDDSSLFPYIPADVSADVYRTGALEKSFPGAMSDPPFIPGGATDLSRFLLPVSLHNEYMIAARHGIFKTPFAVMSAICYGVVAAFASPVDKARAAVRLMSSMGSRQRKLFLWTFMYTLHMTVWYGPDLSSHMEKIDEMVGVSSWQLTRDV